MMVKRYTLNGDRMFPHSEGRWVHGAEYDALAAENERLRKLIDGAAETGEIYERRLSECEAENDALRSRLAENEALLREIYSYAEDQGMETLMDMIDASDSASVVPSIAWPDVARGYVVRFALTHPDEEMPEPGWALHGTFPRSFSIWFQTTSADQPSSASEEGEK